MSHRIKFPPLLGLIALLALFLKLPETPNIFNLFACKKCVAHDPYLPLIAAAYFAFLIALSLLSPPTRKTSQGGLLWALLLAATLTYLTLPNLCPICLLCHACHIAIWILFLIFPSPHSLLPERLYLILLAPISIAALYASLNLTFMAYNHKPRPSISLRPGDPAPALATHTPTLINFVSPTCPYSKEQLPLLNTLIAQTPNAYRLIHITPTLSPEFSQTSPNAEWIEDKDGQLRSLFKVAGYPTLFLIGSDDTIKEIIPGTSKELPERLAHLIKKDSF